MQMTVVIAAIFAAICLGVAITGFASPKEISDPIAFGVLGWWLGRTSKPDEDA